MQEKGFSAVRHIKHIYSLMIMDQLAKAKIANIAILPPESPWAEARVLTRLKERLRINAEILIHTRLRDLQAMHELWLRVRAHFAGGSSEFRRIGSK